MANNPYVNKVVFGSATLVDLTGTTATADKILQGYGAFGADGAWMDGTATSGNVWQDAQGYVHLDDEGGGSPSVGGLVYETGTFSPTEDVNTYTITFSKQHASLPFFTLVMLASGEYDGTLNSALRTYYINSEIAFGKGVYVSSSNVTYGEGRYMYRATNATGSSTGSSATYNPISNTGTGGSSYPRYWVTENTMTAYAGSSTAYYRAGKSYNWIAVWAPTT